MAGKIPNSKKIFVETDYDNVILVNPNEVYADDNKSAAPRLVDHEDLVYYANLETLICSDNQLTTFDKIKIVYEIISFKVVSNTISLHLYAIFYHLGSFGKTR